MPEVFVARHPDWFAQGYSESELKAFGGQPPQMCYSNQGFIDQVVADAQEDFFDGKAAAKSGAQRDGPVLRLGADGQRRLVQVPRLSGSDDSGAETTRSSAMGVASDYFFTFVNKVAREVAKTHPDKYLSTLAYSEYAYHPARVHLEPNVSVQMCLQSRHWWAPSSKENDARFYHDWVSHEKGGRSTCGSTIVFRRLQLWPACIVFPVLAPTTWIRRSRCCPRRHSRGILQQHRRAGRHLRVDQAARRSVARTSDAMLDEFFTRYYGAAGGPLKRFYLRVEDIYSTTANYPEEVQKNHYKQFHQTEEMAWKYLGTEARMAELGKLMDEAEHAWPQRCRKAARGHIPQGGLGLHGRGAQEVPRKTTEKIDVGPIMHDKGLTRRNFLAGAASATLAGDRPRSDEALLKLFNARRAGGANPSGFKSRLSHSLPYPSRRDSLDFLAPPC